MILDQDKENCKRLGIPCTSKKFKELLSQGIFFDAKVNRSSKTLVHCAVCGEMPQYLQMLIDAGANVKIVPRGGRGIPQPLHMACYYSFSSEIIQILCKAGWYPLLFYSSEITFEQIFLVLAWVWLGRSVRVFGDVYM